MSNKKLFHACLFCLKESVYNVLLEALRAGEPKLTNKQISQRLEIETSFRSPDAVLNVMMLTSHMHRHGELFEINQLSTGTLLHRSVSYDDAPITFYDPPLVLDATDGLTFQCTHNNYDGNSILEFGFTSEDEMCLFVGYYYADVNPTADEN